MRNIFPVPTNGTRSDPSGTVTLRRVMCQATGGWFNTFSGLVSNEVYLLDLTTNSVWAGYSDPAKARAFQDWLKQQASSTLVGLTRQQLWDRYLLSASHGGLGKVVASLGKGKSAPPGFAAGQATVLGSNPRFLDNSKLISGKAWTDLQGVTADMVVRLNRILTEGLVKKSNPKAIAAEMTKQVGLSKQRALLIARTEVIRAHAEAQLDGLEALGIQTVTLRVEWLITPKGVCEICGRMGGKTYTVTEARGKIPMHPNCRCCWSPALPKARR